MWIPTIMLKSGNRQAVRHDQNRHIFFKCIFQFVLGTGINFFVGLIVLNKKNFEGPFFQGNGNINRVMALVFLAVWLIMIVPFDYY